MSTRVDIDESLQREKVEFRQMCMQNKYAQIVVRYEQIVICFYNNNVKFMYDERC